MIDDRAAETVSDPSLSPPLFDDRASAQAQPVTPIPRSRFAIAGEYIRKIFMTGSRSLAFIVVLGLATGTLAGMALVQTQKDSVPANEEVSLFATEDEQWMGANVAAQGLTTMTPTIRRPVRSRIRPSNRRPRAYRVAVIR